MVTVGPFYDKTDGVTIETALTITNERITLTADTDGGSAPTNILDNITGATSATANDLNYITGNDAGMMQLELAAADTNRVGRMFLSITDAANHVPVFHEFFVLPQAIYDWLTGVIVPLPANVTQLLGTAWLVPGTAGTPDVNTKLAGGQTVSAAGTVTLPGTVASTTNITAGTITTVTNLTNAPTAGDLTATMKTSVTTAATAATPTAAAVTGAVGSVTGNVGGNVVGTVASVVGAVGSVIGAVGSVTGNVGGVVGVTFPAVVGDALIANQSTINSNVLSVQTSVDDLPTNAELATSQASADDATLAAIAALNNLSAAQVNAEVDTAIADAALATAANLATVIAKTDNLPASPAAVGSAMTLASSLDLYHADIQFTDDGANDEYTITWFKNGVRVTSGITVPTVQVVKRVDGTDLIAATALTQIGTTGSYKLTTATVTTAGEAYLVITAATIDAGSRSFSKLISRDA